MMYDRLLAIHNDFRVFPKAIAFYLAWMFYEFNVWFFAIANTTEWMWAGYVGVWTTIVGFAKFYMDTGYGKGGPNA